jgi:hypothetical protein
MDNYQTEDWWAIIGSAHRCWYPLVAHSADVAAVVEQLLGQTVLSDRLSQTLDGGLTLPKRGEVVEVDKGGALRSGTKKVGRLEESRDVPMDQESGPV